MIIAMLPDQKRLHLQHGPIDLIVEAFGERSEIAGAYRAASKRFTTVLDELVEDLPLLRTPFPPCPQGGGEQSVGAIARTMFDAVRPHASQFITPMAAVAGAVADEILTVMTYSATLEKAYVNNGGDIALYLSRDHDQTFNTGVVCDPSTNEFVTIATIKADTGIKGIATSGYRGRSHSLGIADSVTVFAPTAAAADAAATIIANKIDLPDSRKVLRQPASQLSPDSDLGERLVTMSVGELTNKEIEHALGAGEDKAQFLCQSGLISAAFLCLQGRAKIIQWPDQSIPKNIAFNTNSLPQDRNCYA